MLLSYPRAGSKRSLYSLECLKMTEITFCGSVMLTITLTLCSQGSLGLQGVTKKNPSAYPRARDRDSGSSGRMKLTDRRKIFSLNLKQGLVKGRET